MKRKHKILALFTLFFVLLSSAIFFAACKTEKNKVDDNKVSPTKNTLTLTKTSVQLVYGDSAVVVARYTDEEGKTLEWTTADSTIATVEDGVISSVGYGNTTITAKYGDLTATCAVSVSFGDYQPVLNVSHVGENLSLVVEDTYKVVAGVSFKGKNYACELTAEVADETMASFENGTIKALQSGETDITLKGEWKNFDTPLLEKTFHLTVTDKAVAMYVLVDKGGEETVADTVSLYITDSFEGKKYVNEASVRFVVKENGVEKEGELALTSGNDIIDLTDGKISVKKLGDAVITASYENENGETYTKTLSVKVECPVVSYSQHVEWTDATIKNILTYFEDGAVVLSARQGTTALQNTKKMLIGVVFNGENTQPVEVQTSKGGYIFEDIYGCNELLNDSNFASSLKLSSSVNSKYYGLSGNIGSADNPIDMKSQVNASAAANFAGTFDGRGYTVYAATYDNGIFGGYGYNAVVKNTEFVITFMSNTANGLSNDKGRWAQNPKINATIENVHIITTNFNEGNHVLSTLKVELLTLTDVLIEVNGAENIADFDGRSGVSVLFEVDYVYSDFMMGNAGLECYENVRVVINKFLPMANGDIWNGSTYITFAVNDEEKFGVITRQSTSRATSNYCMITETENYSSWRKSVLYAKDNSTGEYKWTDCLFICYGLQKSSTSGIYRYDTIEDLKKDGITKVGDWVVV